MPKWIYDEDNFIRFRNQTDGTEPAKFAISRVGMHRDVEIRRKADETSLIWLARGAYMPAKTWLALNSTERFAMQVKALVQRGSATILAREAAAAFHGLPFLARGARIDISCSGCRLCQPVQTERGPYIPHSRLRRVSARIHAEDVVDIDGRLVTDIPKTVVDVCRTRTSSNGLLLADASLRGYTTAEELWATFDAYARSPGNVRARRLLSMATEDSESIGESLTKEVIEQSGIAEMRAGNEQVVQQVVFEDSRGFIGRVDFYVPELGLIIEFDGRMKYTDGDETATQQVIARELEREKRLKNLGLTVVRLVWSQLFDGSGVELLRRVAKEIRARINAGLPVYRGSFRVARQGFNVGEKSSALSENRRRSWAKVGRLY